LASQLTRMLPALLYRLFRYRSKKLMDDWFDRSARLKNDRLVKVWLPNYPDGFCVMCNCCKTWNFCEHLIFANIMNRQNSLNLDSCVHLNWMNNSTLTLKMGKKIWKCSVVKVAKIWCSQNFVFYSNTW